MFELPKKIKKTADAEMVIMLQTLVSATEKAWREAIKPRMRGIRHGDMAANKMKGQGTDFFTEADVESEKTIKQELIKGFGDGAFRIFGEEDNRYAGNLNSKLTVRIDPIDGTENFKFGKPSWSIMVGVYAGRGKTEKQIVSVTYYPEYYNEFVCFVDGVGVFISDATTGETREITEMNNQNNLSSLIVAVYRHSNLAKRGRIMEIIEKLDKAGARIHTIAPTDVREALITGGKRAMVIDGDFQQVDFISYSTLFHFGYRIFDWSGNQLLIDDPDIADKKLVIIPPGTAGEQILEITLSAQKAE